MFDNLDEEAGYHNWFPRQTGFNTLSKTQINKDIRDLTAATHTVPCESDDEDIGEAVHSLYDAAAHPRAKGANHTAPDVLQDIWSNELLYYRWRTKKRAFEMHEVLAQRKEAWQTYVAV